MKETSREQRGEESRRELRGFLLGGEDPRRAVDADRILELCRWWLSAPRLSPTLRGPLNQVQFMATAMASDPSSALAFETARITRGLNSQLALVADEVLVVEWSEAGGRTAKTGPCSQCGEIANLSSRVLRGIVVFAQECSHCRSHTISTMEDSRSFEFPLAPDDHVAVHELELFLRS